LKWQVGSEVSTDRRQSLRRVLHPFLHPPSLHPPSSTDARTGDRGRAGGKGTVEVDVDVAVAFQGGGGGGVGVGSGGGEARQAR